MQSLGADEILNFSFVSPDAPDKLLLAADDDWRKVISIMNPLSRDISVMRTQLVYGMLTSIARNCARKNDKMRFYELGKVFVADKLPLEKLPQERDVLCVGICNDGDFYTIKSIVGEVVGMFGVVRYTPSTEPYLHPKQALHVEVGGIVGNFGKLHPLVCENYDLPENVYVAHLDMTDALNAVLPTAKYTQLSKQHPIDRDLAVVVEKTVAVGDMLAAVKAVSPYIAEVKLFDIYDGEQIADGYKSVAFSVRLQPTDAPFSDSKIKEIMDSILQIASSQFGAKLR